MKSQNDFGARPYRAGALALVGLTAAALAARPAAAAMAIPADFSSSYSTGASGSGLFGASYTPYYFDINFDNTTGDTYTVSSATFNGDDGATVNDINNGDVFGSYTGSVPFSISPGTSTQPSVFELDVDGNVPAGTTLTGDLDFEGQDDATGQSGTVADPVLNFTVPQSASAAPEPSGSGVLALTGLALGGLLLRARRRRAA